MVKNFKMKIHLEYILIFKQLFLFRLSPMGVLFLVASKVLELDDFGVIVGRLGMYFITVVFGLFVHGFVLLPLMYSLFTRQLPFQFTLNMGQAIITAFGTASR